MIVLVFTHASCLASFLSLFNVDSSCEHMALDIVVFSSGAYLFLLFVSDCSKRTHFKRVGTPASFWVFPNKISYSSPPRQMRSRDDKEEKMDQELHLPDILWLHCSSSEGKYHKDYYF